MSATGDVGVDDPARVRTGAAREILNAVKSVIDRGNECDELSV